MNEKIPFNLPKVVGKELEYLAECCASGRLAGDGPFTQRIHEWLEQRTKAPRALLTHSGTASLEMAALLMNVQPGDEVIMPSYTFVSTANAFVLRGAIPVFVDIRPDTMNMDEMLIEAAVSEKTTAVVPVHYAGVSCEMDTILSIAQRLNLGVVEDAAQGLMSTYKGRALGTIGNVGALSFHETKNIISGEGGGLLINDRSLIEKAEIIREKGTDRSRFFRGEVDKYTWQEVGSSFLPGELTAAFLWAQLEVAEQVTQERLAIWNRYHSLLEPMEVSGVLRRPIIPADCVHNGHMYYVLLAPGTERDKVLQLLKTHQIHSVFHYVPLHSSPAGKRYCKVAGSMKNTDELSERLVRLPLWLGLTEEQQKAVVASLSELLVKKPTPAPRRGINALTSTPPKTEPSYMAKPKADNISGHQTRYQLISANNRPEDVGKIYVGDTADGDPKQIGYLELEVVRLVMGDRLAGSSVVDIGCGIGRLTQFLLHEPIKGYLGLDVVPEILDEARRSTHSDPRFSFDIAKDFRIPKPDGSVDLTVGFSSVLGSLLDEEMFDYMEETRRVLRADGVAIFSFQDIASDALLNEFVRHSRAIRQGHGMGELLRWTSKEFVERLARAAGFIRVEFISGQSNLRHSGISSRLMPGKAPTGTYQFWQSLAILRV